MSQLLNRRNWHIDVINHYLLKNLSALKDCRILAKAQITYNDMIITAPFAGKIGVVKVRVGDSVKKGDYLFSLINKKDMSIFLELPETLYGKISKNTEVILSDTNGNNVPGKITATTPIYQTKELLV